MGGCRQTTAAKLSLDLALLALSWNLKVYLHPLPAHDFNTFIERATVGVVPGWFVFTVGVFFNAASPYLRSAQCACVKQPAKFCRSTNFLYDRCKQ